MTKTKSTKRALFSSALALLLCCTMLLGTTFAWFTDEVKTGSTVITSGTLDIVLEYWDGDSWEDAEGKVIPFVAADGRSEILWEPGCTYEMAPFRVRNEGNLTAKILILLNGVEGDEKLMEAIELKTRINNIPESLLNGSAANQLQPLEDAEVGVFYAMPEGNVLFDWSLAGKGITTPGTGHTDTSPEFTVFGHMEEEAGNEYQDLSIEGISITVIATQETYESDSFNNRYDAGAEYDINHAYIGNVKYDTIAAAIDAAEDGDTIRLTRGVFHEALDLQGKALTIQGDGKETTIIAGPADYTTANIPMQSWVGWSGQDANVYALISADEDVTIKDLTVRADPKQIAEVAEFRHEGSCAFVGIHVQSANATIENVDIEDIKPETVTGNDHHNFGLYITSAADDTAGYTATYTNGTVSDVNRGGIYCWSGNYTLRFDDVTVVGPGSPTDPNGTLTPAAGSENNNAIYAFCPFYVQSPATYSDVVIRDAWCVAWWGGASWNWADSAWSTNPPTGVTCINCGTAN